MTDDTDLRDTLPDPPPPRPDRRAAAIAQAMRRFDGDTAVPPRSVAMPTRRRRRIGTPQIAAWASVALVALIGVPTWLANDHRFTPPAANRATPRAAMPVTAPKAVPSSTGRAPDAASVAVPRSPLAASDGAVARKEMAAASPAVTAPTTRGEDTSEPASEFAPAPPPPPPPPPPAPEALGLAAAPAQRRAPVAEDAGSDIVVTGSAVPRRPVARGDWNACTIDDPKRDLSKCRRSIGSGAKDEAGRASADLADGLSRAWDGDADAAIAAFDRALMIAPRLPQALLNRGMAWRRAGNSDRALADLDAAVRLAPNAARYRYHRALVLRERGDIRRARADERQAVALDARYVAVID